jgi:hypothetical protein
MIGLVEPVYVGDPNQQKVEFNAEDREDPNSIETCEDFDSEPLANSRLQREGWHLIESHLTLTDGHLRDSDRGINHKT